MDDEEGRFCVFFAFLVIMACSAPECPFLTHQCISCCVAGSCYLVLGIELRILLGSLKRLVFVGFVLMSMEGFVVVYIQ